MYKIKAVIFDMDGVLIDSEPFWQAAEMAVFKGVGLHLTQEDCHKTMGLRIDQLVAYWAHQAPQLTFNRQQVIDDILDHVIQHIAEQGEAKPGVLHALEMISRAGLPIGLASSSPERLIQAILHRLGIRPYFTITHSAEHESHGKPHPAVYLSTAQRMGVLPPYCLAIEDSFNGLLAAKAATMKAIIIPDPSLQQDPRLAIADYKLDSLSELSALHLGITELAELTQ